MKAIEMLKLCQYLATFETDKFDAPDIIANCSGDLVVIDYFTQLDARIMGEFGFVFAPSLGAFRYTED